MEYDPTDYGLFPDCGTGSISYDDEIQAYSCMECDAAFSIEEIEE